MSLSAPSNPPFRKLTPIYFQFLDVLLELSSDKPEFFDTFSEMYRWFKVPVRDEGVKPTLSFSLQTNTDNPWNAPVLLLDDQVIDLSDPYLLQDFFIYEIIFNSVLDRVRSHIMLHACALGLAGKSVIIAGDSGHGKTTLTLKLLHQGLSLLSDEIAALGRFDRLVHPFPRSLRIRPDSLEKTGFQTLGNTTHSWGGKLLLDAQQLRPGCIGDPSPTKTVILLKNPSHEVESPPDDQNRTLRVITDRLEEALVDNFLHLSVVRSLTVDRERHFPVLNFVVDHQSSAIFDIDQLCRKNGILILEIIRREIVPVSFNQPPRLEEIPRSRAVIELLSMYQGSYHSDLLTQEFTGNPAQIFWELAKFLDNARCYHLYVGDLSKMAELILESMSASK